MNVKKSHTSLEVPVFHENIHGKSVRKQNKEEKDVSLKNSLFFLLGLQVSLLTVTRFVTG